MVERQYLLKLPPDLGEWDKVRRRCREKRNHSKEAGGQNSTDFDRLLGGCRVK